MLQQLDTWFNSPRGHAVVAGLFVVAAQIWPSHAAELNQAAIVMGYGAAVAGAPKAAA